MLFTSEVQNQCALNMIQLHISYKIDPDSHNYREKHKLTTHKLENSKQVVVKKTYN